MAKSAVRRKQAARIYMNWVYQCKKDGCRYKLESLSFGRVFKQDPWDCGYPQCNVCTSWKVEDNTKRRQSLRKDERDALKDIG